MLACGFPRQHLYVIKEGGERIDEVQTVPAIEALPETVDLLVIAAAASQLPAIIDQAVASEKVRSAILIPGGVGETEGSEDVAAAVKKAIAAGRERRQSDGAPVITR